MMQVFVRLMGLLFVLGLAACATPYDPAGQGRYSLETRARESGRSAASEGLQIFARRNVGRRSTAAPDRFSPPNPGVPAPGTPAGKQFSWLMTQFNGTVARQLAPNFSESFLRATPESGIRSALVQWKRDEFADGPAEVQAIEESDLGRVTAVIRGRVTDRYSRVQLATDKWGLIASLSLSALPEYKPGDLSTWNKIETRLAEQPGRAGLAAYEITGDALLPVFRHRSESPLAIDGLSGLYIAGALTEAVGAGSAAWNEPLAIDDEFKSLMGGRLQLEPSEAEFPLSQYLSLLLSPGDNTAFDHLLLRVGRDAVETYMSRFCAEPVRNRPFLATMEYFRIKLGSDRALPPKFAAADEQGRRALLSPGGPVDKSVPSLAAAANWRLPFEVERVGWFASPDDACRLLADLVRASRRPGMEPLAAAVRQGRLPDAGSAWRTASLKSGSEPGIVAMAWFLERSDGRVFVMTLLANDPKAPLNHSDLSSIATAAVGLLAEHGLKK